MSKGRALLLLLVLGGLLILLLSIVLPAQQMSSLTSLSTSRDPAIATVQVRLENAPPSSIATAGQPSSQIVNGVEMTLYAFHPRQDAAFDVNVCYTVPADLADLPAEWLAGPASAEINGRLFLGLESTVIDRSPTRLCRQFTFHPIPDEASPQPPQPSQGQMRVLFESLFAVAQEGKTCQVYEYMLNLWVREGHPPLNRIACQEINGSVQVHFSPAPSFAIFEQWMARRLRIEGPWTFILSLQ